ncbi:PadR family transcriptional regulator [Lacisediminihabitans profunda]|uniref:PadR family transcriptional regulator n=1 Tax=Lacisediminihabitans profunda TaxID=2594790 RepID=A0A5C8UMB0_9MICO|nr:PadR family transcriptional regulator [Lacisediminihabitans profunda]TXN29509.1 PadR family transcriptional regulator [Lacisediminihabitans profunda]
MSLRYALLALLTAQPMTGYDLAKAFHSSVGHVWHAPDSQIYPELKRMEAEGLVVATAVARNSRATSATKRIYSISDAGIAAFREWMETPIEYVRERDPAHLRAAYFEWTDPETVRTQLRAHIEHWTEQREQWQIQLGAIRDQSHPITARRLEIFPETEWPRIIGYKIFVYEGLVDRASQQIAWATRGLALVDELEGRR